MGTEPDPGEWKSGITLRDFRIVMTVLWMINHVEVEKKRTSNFHPLMHRGEVNNVAQIVEDFIHKDENI
jgi:hypothetical protein